MSPLAFRGLHSQDDDDKVTERLTVSITRSKTTKPSGSRALELIGTWRGRTDGIATLG